MVIRTALRELQLTDLPTKEDELKEWIQNRLTLIQRFARSYMQDFIDSLNGAESEASLPKACNELSVIARSARIAFQQFFDVWENNKGVPILDKKDLPPEFARLSPSPNMEANKPGTNTITHREIRLKKAEEWKVKGLLSAGILQSLNSYTDSHIACAASALAVTKKTEAAIPNSDKSEKPITFLF